VVSDLFLGSHLALIREVLNSAPPAHTGQ